MWSAQETEEKVNEFIESSTGKREVKKHQIYSRGSPAGLRYCFKACFLLVVTWLYNRNKLLCLYATLTRFLLKVQSSLVKVTELSCFLSYVHSSVTGFFIKLSSVEESCISPGTFELFQMETLKVSLK